MNHRGAQSPVERRLRSKLRRLLADGGILHASAIVMRRVCGKPNCRCARGHKHVSLYVSRRIDGKQYMKCVPKAKEPQIKSWVRRYRDVLETIDQLSAIYWKEFEHKE